MSVIWPSLVPTQSGPASPGVFDVPVPSNTGAEPVSGWLQPSYKAGDGLLIEPVRELSGVIWPGVNDTFYNRILIEPALLALGNLLTNQTRSIVVWNGFLASKTLGSFQRLNDGGISVIEPVTTPYVMSPLEELTYVFSVSTDGPSVIDATYTWAVDGIDYNARVTGRRVVIWPYAPSWDTPVTETLSWLTNILRAFDGSEQRRGLRTKARRSFSYSFKVARRESSRLENLLWGWQNRVYALPVWTDRSRMTEDRLQGDTFIAMPTDTYSFTAGALAVFYKDTAVMEAAEIESVDVAGLSLVRPLESDWPKGTLVMPMILGHLPTAVPIMRLTSQAMLGTLAFTTDPVTTDPYTPDQVAPTTYDGLEVLTRQPNWKGGLSNEFSFMFDQLDQRTGAITWDTTEETPRITRGYGWLLNGRLKIRDFRSMLGRRLGMRNPLYVPSWHDDFKVTQNLGDADVGLYVENNEFLQMVGNNPARNRLMIRLTNGQVFYRQIVGVSNDSQSTILTIDAPLGQTVFVDQFKTVHLLMRSRLATDEINIVWRTSQAAVVDTSFITVPE